MTYIAMFCALVLAFATMAAGAVADRIYEAQPRQRAPGHRMLALGFLFAACIFLLGFWARGLA